MRLRRARLAAVLAPDEIAPTVTVFPLLGVTLPGGFTRPAAAPMGPFAASAGIPDACINPHPRFGALTANIRERRGSCVDIRLPLFKDVHTPEFTASGGGASGGGAAGSGAGGEAPCVRMDAMAYGMGCCCLQVTVQAADEGESRLLFDHMAVLAPIFLALTAASPIMAGRLVDTDTRSVAVFRNGSWHL